MAGPRLLTGDRPSGPLHLGHLAGSISSRLRLQVDHECFILLADLQLLTDRPELATELPARRRELLADYLAAGLDPARCRFVTQSALPALPELFAHFLNLVTLSRVSQNPTVRTESRQRGLGQSMPLGFLVYPVSQAADILGFDADVCPVGDDQLPMLELTRFVAGRFNRAYGKVFKVPGTLLSSTPRLPGIDGVAKASKSLGNAIDLAEPTQTLHEKVMRMYTDLGHVHVADPGRVEGNVVFSYLDAFDDRAEELADLKAHYRRGGLGDVELKRRLIEVLENVISPIRARRNELEGEDGYLDDLLEEGVQAGRLVTGEVLGRARSAMGI